MQMNLQRIILNGAKFEEIDLNKNDIIDEGDFSIKILMIYHKDFYIIFSKINLSFLNRSF